MDDKNKTEEEAFEIGGLSFILSFLCPPLWIFLYLIYILNYCDDSE